MGVRFDNVTSQLGELLVRVCEGEAAVAEAGLSAGNRKVVEASEAGRLVIYRGPGCLVVGYLAALGLTRNAAELGRWHEPPKRCR